MHQERQAPSDLRVVRVAAGVHKPHALVVQAGLAKSNGEAVRLLRQRAVRRDGAVLDAGADVVLAPGVSFVLSVGAARHVRIEATLTRHRPRRPSIALWISDLNKRCYLTGRRRNMSFCRGRYTGCRESGP